MQPDPPSSQTAHPAPPQREGPQAPPPGQLLRVAAIFYGLLLLAALLWRSWIGGSSLLYLTPEAAAAGLSPLRNLGAGIGVGLALVAASRFWIRHSAAAAELSASLSSLLGPLSNGSVLLLAGLSGVAEEAFFRGALQPRVGLVAASLLFGLAHFVPRRGLAVWAPAAVVAGLVLGALMEWTGNLVAPVVAHAVVNALNLRWLTRDALSRAAASGRGGALPGPE